LLSLPIPAEYPQPDIDPQRAKQHTLEAVVTWITGLAAEQPVLLVIEDLHWFDPSSLEFLTVLLPRVPMARVLVLLLYRPTFEPPWAALPNLTTLPLQRLAAEQVAAMIDLVSGGRVLPRSVVRDIASKADGVPLYIEELTKMLLESGQLVDHGGRLELTDSSAGLAIPVTLQESLAARLDRLAPVKEVVQLGAALGRSFTYEQIRAVSLLDEVTLNTELGRLVEADILQLHGSPPDATFVFKHALIQDAAYDSLVSRRRREYHRRIAAALTERFPDLCENEPELIARHWERAGNAEAAVAGLVMLGLCIAGLVLTLKLFHLDHGLSLLESVARNARRPQRELELQLALGTALVAAKGFAAPEVAAAYTRARELCETTGETGHALYTVLSGLLLYHQSRAELTRCLDLTHERLTLAERLGDAALEMQVYENFGTLAFWRGEFAAVPEHLERSVARWTRERDRVLARNYGTLSAVVCETYNGQVLWFLGYPDQAVTRADNAVQQARAFGRANSLALAMSFAMSLRLLRVKRRSPGSWRRR
jgi:predicted ATPase